MPHKQIRNENVKIATLLLESLPAEDRISYIIPDGQHLTALSEACKYLNSEFALLLLDHLPQCTKQVYLQTRSGRALLHAAVKHGMASVVSALIHTMPVERRDAFLFPRDAEGYTPLIFASKYGQTDLVSLILNHISPEARHSCLLHKTSYGTTALIAACHANYPAVVSLLLSYLPIEHRPEYIFIHNDISMSALSSSAHPAIMEILARELLLAHDYIPYTQSPVDTGRIVNRISTLFIAMLRAVGGLNAALHFLLLLLHFPPPIIQSESEVWWAGWAGNTMNAICARLGAETNTLSDSYILILILNRLIVPNVADLADPLISRILALPIPITTPRISSLSSPSPASSDSCVPASVVLKLAQSWCKVLRVLRNLGRLNDNIIGLTVGLSGLVVAESNMEKAMGMDMDMDMDALFSPLASAFLAFLRLWQHGCDTTGILAPSQSSSSSSSTCLTSSSPHFSALAPSILNVVWSDNFQSNIIDVLPVPFLRYLESFMYRFVHM